MVVILFNIKSKIKILNLVTVIAMIVSTFYYIKLTLKVGVAQIDKIYTGLYVLAIVLSILSFITSWKNRQVT